MGKRFVGSFGLLGAAVCVWFGCAQSAMAASELAAGDRHMLFLQSTGNLWSWGNNTAGQLGDGTTQTRRSPVRVAGTWMSVAAGANHTVAIAMDGSLWAWGQNWLGKLGDGTTQQRNAPVRIGAEQDRNWISVRAGLEHTVALKSDGTLWAWGSNEYYQLNNPNLMQATRPDRVAGSDWIAIAAGFRHTAALKADGTLWTWGDNSYGQLGWGSNVQARRYQQVGTDSDWVAVAAGAWHTAALKANGTLWAWGKNETGQLGNNANTSANSPVRIGADSDWVTVQAGAFHTLGLKSNGSVWVWGENNSGQLGTGSSTSSITPVRLGTDTDWIAIAAGSSSAAAMKSDGTVWTWGRDELALAPRVVPTFLMSDRGWKSVAAGGLHSLVLNSRGRLYASGSGYRYQLGDGVHHNISGYRRIGADQNWVSVVAGEKFSAALKSDGSLWFWGTMPTHLFYIEAAVPTRVGSDSDWVELAAGRHHVLARKSNGELWAWGENYDGQLGDGTREDRNTPVKVLATGGSWKKIAAGGHLSLALRADGTLWRWGAYFGATPVQVSPSQVASGTNTNWVSIACGDKHTLATKSDGTLWGWGWNLYGQLGIGSPPPQVWEPVWKRIGADADWVDVAAGFGHSVAGKSNRTLWLWGRNAAGQLGDGTTTNRGTPTGLIIGVDSSRRAFRAGASFAAGSEHTLAVSNKGTVFAWGQNGWGQVGDTTFVSRYRPVEVLSQP